MSSIAPTTTPPPEAGVPSAPEEVEVVVVGAGFGGLGFAIRLRQAGVRDFVVLERGPEVGGTWRSNTYPGCQCDVPSNLYSFSFAPKPDWTHSFPEQPQILAYLRDCADRFGVREYLRLGCELREAHWLEAEQRWHVTTSHGELRARVLVAAPGLLSEPAVPRLAGLDRFGGTIFHSSDWNHELDLSGQRVALIGTGATAVQIGPRIAPQVAALHVFQRTAPWVLPHSDRPIHPGLQRLYRVWPGLQQLARGGVFALRESYAVGLVLQPRVMRLFRAIALAHMRRQVPDAQLRARLTPDYEIGCKRMLLSNDWYPMLTAANVELVTEPISEIDERAVVTEDGNRHEVDAIVLATGFTPTDPPIAHRLRGSAGRTLAEVWEGSPEAYLGTAVAGFPNLFLLYGPNINLGHSSIVYMLESQIEYVLQALRTMRDRDLATLEVRPQVQQAWNADLQRRLSRTVWNRGGCGSWYIDSTGRNSIQWPGFCFGFRRRLRRFDVEEYRINAAGTAPAATRGA